MLYDAMMLFLNLFRAIKKEIYDYKQSKDACVPPYFSLVKIPFAAAAAFAASEYDRSSTLFCK